MRLASSGSDASNVQNRAVPHLRGTRQTPFLIVQKLGRAVLGRNIHPHQLRHSFGSTLIEHGADPRSVQALMGHADIETTMRYVHVDMRTIKQVHSKCHPRGGNRASK